jgi:heme-degrading monooxygenase HmoA
MGWAGRARGIRLGASDINHTEVTMFARTSTWTGSPEALQKWAHHVTSQVAPMVRGLPGIAGAVFLLDRADGAAMTLTLWDSQEAALVSDQHADASRAATIAATGVDLVARGRYEIVTRF